MRPATIAILGALAGFWLAYQIYNPSDHYQTVESGDECGPNMVWKVIRADSGKPVERTCIPK